MLAALITLCAPALSRAALVAAWGDNTYGQTRLPADDNNVKALAGGVFHNLALQSDGSVFAWGAWGLNDQDQINVPTGLANVKAIAAGSFHSLALKTDGSVVAWGNNYWGQTNVPGNLSRVTGIACGGGHNLALNAGGTLVAWGNNDYGQTNVPAGLTDAIAVAAGDSHSLALKSDGSVVAWGQNAYGQTNVPPDLSNVVAIATRADFNLALKGDGTVVAWGQNSQGQTNVPVGLSNVTAIAAGFYHGMALTTDGRVVTWGGNSYGQSAVPAGLSNVTAIAAGAFHSLALVPDGPPQILLNPGSQAVAYTSNVTFSASGAGRGPLSYLWFFKGAPVNPNNIRVSGAMTPTLTLTNLQFSDIGTYALVISNAFGSVISSNATLAVISPPFITSRTPDQTVPAGGLVSLSVTASGTPPLMYQWSFNGTNLVNKTSAFLYVDGQPSDSGVYSLVVSNVYGSVSTNIQLTVTDSAPYFTQQPVVYNSQIGRLLTVPTLPLGSWATLTGAARGSLPLTYQWRFNGVDIANATNTLLSLTNLSLGQAGYYTLVASNAFGETVSTKLFLNVVQVYVWDKSSGSSSTTPTNVPINLTNVTAVASGAYHLLALRNDGRVAIWTKFVNSSSSGVTNIPASVTNVSAIAASGFNSMALRSNGTVVVWGDNFSGQTNVPSTVTNVTAIATGSSFCFALRANGTVAAWGNGSFGETVVPSNLSNVVAIAAGGVHGLALKADGKVVAWGSNSFGQTNVPVSLSNVIAIAAGGSSSLALKSDGTIVTWGSTNGVLPSSLTNLVAFAFGTDRNFGLRPDGSLVSWFNGKLFPAITLSNIISVAVSDRDTYAAAVIGNGSPNLTLHPYSQIVQRGNTVQLHARATGVQPMQYQWLLDNLPLPGATNSSLLLSNVLGKDTGAYRMIASNDLGAALSQIANITIPVNTNLAAALNTTNLTWGNVGTTNWFAQIRESHDGDAAAQSGVIANNQQSILQSAITGPGTLTFWWKVSSEEGFDFLSFYLDNTTIPIASVSGETVWEQKTCAIPTGTHTLRWAYSKDVSVSAGRDAGWVDEVIFTPSPPTANISPANLTVATGNDVSFFAVTVSVAKPVTFQWMHVGTNLVNATNQTLLLPVVGRKDRGSYSVRVGNPGGSVTTSNATLMVNIPQRLGPVRRDADGGVEIFSRDADGGPLSASDLAAFEAQATTNLLNWEPLPHSLSLTNGSIWLQDINATNLPQRFYRLVEH